MATLALCLGFVACSSSTTNESGGGGSDAGLGGTGGATSGGTGGATSGGAGGATSGGAGGATSGGTGGATGGSSSGGAANCEPATCKIDCCASANPNQAQTLFDLMTSDYCPGTGCSGVCPLECGDLQAPLDAIRCFKCLLGDSQSWAGKITTDCSQLDKCSGILACIAQCSAK